MSNKKPQQLITISIIVIFSVILLGYIYFRSKAIIMGPQIDIQSPKSGTTFDESFITISGKAKNTSVITLNGNPIFITPSGDFTEQLVLSPGYNIITLFGEDKFGKIDEERLILYLNQEKDSYKYANTEPLPLIPEDENQTEEIPADNISN